MITDAVFDHIALGGAEDLLDAERLAELVGRPAAITSLRVKPGESLLVAWSQGPLLEEHGWAMLTAGTDKRDGILRRAAKVGAAVSTASRRGIHLLTGGVESDPQLAGPLASARRRLKGSPQLEVLRYNPGRRIVLRTADTSPNSDPHAPDSDPLSPDSDPLSPDSDPLSPDSDPLSPDTQPDHRPRPDTQPNHRSLYFETGAGALLSTRDARPAWDREPSSKAAGIVSKGSRAQVLRVAAKSLLPLLAVEGEWERLGAPVIRHTIQRRRDTAAVTPFWGLGDLSSVRDPRAAEQAGRAIAGVHEGSAGPTVVHAPGRGLVGMVETLSALLPHRDELLAEIAWRLGPSEDHSATVSLHGDLTPDQILTDGSTIRIADLDRSHRGSAGTDLGWWSAGCMLLGAPKLETAFLDGYTSVRPAPDLDLWRARALLTFALIPFRRWQPDWQAETERRIDLAAHTLGITPSLETLP
ncbi:protein kinase family protein [Tessaracoccus caeni]|uniref:hypothetical protein n=1 Tax=Tessaracoccus caeni TaxID=3031239 RepID=UPI0023D98580|nr:hypothetical protein [Tessaracoccus caeni]MDF1488557.1 hypothetical protein [Tessaracoccus caeni]